MFLRNFVASRKEEERVRAAIHIRFGVGFQYICIDLVYLGKGAAARGLARYVKKKIVIPDVLEEIIHRNGHLDGYPSITSSVIHIPRNAPSIIIFTYYYNYH
jgi:hypothetical protein